MVKKMSFMVIIAIFGFAAFADEPAPINGDVENAAVQNNVETLVVQSDGATLAVQSDIAISVKPSLGAESEAETAECSAAPQKNRKNWSERIVVFDRGLDGLGDGCTCSGSCAGPLCLQGPCNGTAFCCQQCHALGCVHCTGSSE